MGDDAGLKPDDGRQARAVVTNEPTGRRCATIFFVIERIVRVAENFREAEGMDRADLAEMSLEQRISAVERLRRERFGEDRAESRLERALVGADRPKGEVRARGADTRWPATASLGSPKISKP